MRIRADRKFLLPVLCSPEDEYFSVFPAGKDITFRLGEHEIFCDVGAYNGCSVHKFLSATRWSYAAIHSFEPDARNFSNLENKFFKHLPNFYSRNVAVSDCQGTMNFLETGTMGSKIAPEGTAQVHAVRLDDELERVTFIKMDVEGHETKVLQGARRLIAECRPRMAITCYHYADDLLDIAQLIHDINPAYRLRIRHHCFYPWDTVLYADIPS
jgi:FkbM family methyltransferase